MNSSGIVILAGTGDSTWVLANRLHTRFGVKALILEEKVSRWVFLKKRIRKQGVIRVAGQILFMILITPVLRKASVFRIAAIRKEHKLNAKPPQEFPVLRVKSANSQETHKLLRSLEPAVVVINGTRILSQETISSINVPMINMHAGITPLFRGVHGAYWALVVGLPQFSGVTVHRIDQGIDTGEVLRQATIYPTRDDNFTTYPLLQLVAGLPLLEEVIECALANQEILPVTPPPMASRLWHHPTIAEYIWNRVRKGVR